MAKVLIWFEDRGLDNIRMGCDSEKINSLLAEDPKLLNKEIPLTGAEFCAMTGLAAVRKALQDTRRIQQARGTARSHLKG